MDRRFSTDYQWFASSAVCLRSFLEEAANSEYLLKEKTRVENGPLANDDNSLAQVFAQRAGCSKEFADSVFSDSLNMEQFVNNPRELGKTFDEAKMDLPDLKPSLLRTHFNIVKRNEYCDSSRQRKSVYVTSLKYDRFQVHHNESSSMIREQPAVGVTGARDIVLIVDAIVPYNRILTSAELRSSRLLRAQSKFLIRGDMLLSDLRRKLMCVSDVVVPMEDGKELETPDMNYSSAELYPSSFIFIDDTFYVDMSHPKAIDISEPIRTFMSRKKIFDPVKAVEMEGVRIIDLNLRLGAPYVFQHSGFCEHLLIFHDLRLMHPSDPQNLDCYPVAVFERGGEKKCDGCHRAMAAYVVEKSDLLPNTYTMFCDECFREFNISNGVKTCNFRAWPFFELNRLRID